ncbi:hypothetical protein [Asaia sp. VD9]|uniref:hypothetical protein n=1 Tax=Asaia sp. VD9 TaxID=3081235 RepID=UPI003019DB9D
MMARSSANARLIAGVLQHSVPFTSVSPAIWTVLMQALVECLEDMQKAAEFVLSKAPKAVDERAELRVERANVSRQHDALIADAQAAEAMPPGWWLSSARRRRNAALDVAEAALKAWQEGGWEAAEREARRRVSMRVRRANKRILAFNTSAEAGRARDVLAGLPDVRAALEGQALDPELYAVLMMTAGRGKLNADGAYVLMKRRIGIQAAQNEASEVTGDFSPVPERRPKPQPSPAVKRG